jgi:hypothetical protein
MAPRCSLSSVILKHIADVDGDCSKEGTAENIPRSKYDSTPFDRVQLDLRVWSTTESISGATASDEMAEPQIVTATPTGQRVRHFTSVWQLP